jgi:saccharopine dehydrogenase-like NADP-dependent oxidoreductase
MSQPVRVLVLGAGKIGRLVCFLLSQSGRYEVTLADANPQSAEDGIKRSNGQKLALTQSVSCDFSSYQDLTRVIHNKQYVLSCAPFHCNQLIAEVCLEKGVNYLDLTEDVATTKHIKQLANQAPCAFIPQCGLAPGFISIVAHDLAAQFTQLDSVKMRVGALPMFPHNRLKYNLTWSTEGLINEYCNPCEAVVDGKFCSLPPLEGLELFSLDGQEYEAFNTSGGLGTLAETLCGRVRNADYKSIRYPGHRDIIALLLHDLKLIDDRNSLCRMLDNALPHTYQDVVIVFVTVTGVMGTKLSQSSFAKKIYHREIDGEKWGAIQITTAAGICGVLDLHVQGMLPKTGFIKQEDVSLNSFLENQFGKFYNA